MSANLAPVQKAERIDVLDILRGYALYAILIGNIQTVRVPWFTPGFVLENLAPIDQIAHRLIYTTLGTELYLVFSFLFGLGFAVQISRAQTKGVQGIALFVRRMVVLFIIGSIHFILIWDGDILRVYAIFGIVLLLLNILPDRALLIGALVVLLISPFATRWMENNLDFGGGSSEDVLTEIRAVYGSGTYGEVVNYRVNNYFPDLLESITFDGLNVLAMFMLGMYAGRRKIFEDISKYRMLFVVGMVGGLIAAIVGDWTGISILHRPGMAALHICTVTLLAQYPWWSKKLSVLIPFGRLSLTNYIVQNIIATTIFYGYGFGYMEKMGTAAVLVISLIIAAVQIVYSYLWQQRFNFGPLEWVWRSLTYGRPMPMRRTDIKPAEAAPAT
jgi:uncharacterized protein